MFGNFLNIGLYCLLLIFLVGWIVCVILFSVLEFLLFDLLGSRFIIGDEWNFLVLLVIEFFDEEELCIIGEDWKLLIWLVIKLLCLNLVFILDG